jgi:8-oxo-dGTP pyrophosphatase MutT (NUDIX family)
VNGMTHAGAVVFRNSNGGRQYLIVSSTTDSTTWVLPKGHIEENETLEAAALRELAEEAGVQGEVITKLGVLAYRKDADDVRATMFLVRYGGTSVPSENRRLEWVEPDVARIRLIEDSRALIDRAEEALTDRYLAKACFLKQEVDALRKRFRNESEKHKRMYRRLRYPAFVLTASSGALATLAITFPAYQLHFNLVIVGITAILAVITALEGLRHPRELWIHERMVHHGLEDLRRDLEYHTVTNWNEDELDSRFTRLQVLLGGSTATWHGYVQQWSGPKSDFHADVIAGRATDVRLSEQPVASRNISPTR